jgi:hypothetical protein
VTCPRCGAPIAEGFYCIRCGLCPVWPRRIGRNMKTLKIDDEELSQACRNLKDANAALSRATQSAKAAKQLIRQRLIDLRDVDIGALEIGELVQVERLLLIEIAKQSRFDEARFQLDQAELYQSYKKDFPVIKYKSLIQEG